MATSHVRLEGFRELEAALRELPKATGKNVLRRVAKGALQPMADEAAAKAPRRSGALAYSIIVSEKRTKAAKKPNSARMVNLTIWFPAKTVPLAVTPVPVTTLVAIVSPEARNGVQMC